MTLFIETPKRKLEINEAYVMAVTFLIFFAVGKIFKSVVEKHKRKSASSKKVNVNNLRGGNLGLEFSDDSELANTILTCMADNERYLVKDPEIIKMIFYLVKAKIKNESLILTPNLMRFLVLKLINKDQTLMVKIGNIIVSSKNRSRLFARISGSAILGFIGAFASILPYTIFMMFFYFNITENCGYKCSEHFEKLPKEGNIEIYKRESTDHVFIAGNNDVNQIELYTPSKSDDQVTIISNGIRKKTTTYNKVRKKAKQVNFSDFKHTDPVLSTFENAEEPKIPQKKCPINDDNIIIYE